MYLYTGPAQNDTWQKIILCQLESGHIFRKFLTITVFLNNKVWDEYGISLYQACSRFYLIRTVYFDITLVFMTETFKRTSGKNKSPCCSPLGTRLKRLDGQIKALRKKLGKNLILS